MDEKHQMLLEQLKNGCFNVFKGEDSECALLEVDTPFNSTEYMAIVKVYQYTYTTRIWWQDGVELVGYWSEYAFAVSNAVNHKIWG